MERTLEIKEGYYPPTETRFGNGVVRAYRPILTPREREIRMQAIARAMADMCLAVDRRKRGIEVPSGARLSEGMELIISYGETSATDNDELITWLPDPEADTEPPEEDD